MLKTIAFLASGRSIHTVRWVNDLTQLGHKIHLVTMHPPDPMNLLDERISVHVLKINRSLGYVLNVWELRRLLLKIQPTLLHAHYASGYGTLARWSGFHPLLFSVWGSDVYVFPDEAKWKKKLLRRNLRAADFIASTSMAMKGQVERFGKFDRPIAVTPFGVDCELFRPMEETGNMSDSFTIGTVKALESCYGVEYLIRAFSIVRKRHPTVKMNLLIVGEGSLRSDLEHLARELGVEDVTEFKGRVSAREVPRYLNQLSVYVAVSLSESFGVAVLEASACGIPVVVSDAGGLPEVVKNGVTGFVVLKENAEAAADAMQALIVDPELRKRLGNNGRKFVLENFERVKVTKKMDDLYHRIVQEFQKDSIKMVTRS